MRLRRIGDRMGEKKVREEEQREGYFSLSNQTGAASRLPRKLSHSKSSHQAPERALVPLFNLSGQTENFSNRFGVGWVWWGDQKETNLTRC